MLRDHRAVQLKFMGNQHPMACLITELSALEFINSCARGDVRGRCDRKFSAFTGIVYPRFSSKFGFSKGKLHEGMFERHEFRSVTR
jgi:hypothetical protein